MTFATTAHTHVHIGLVGLFVVLVAALLLMIGFELWRRLIWLVELTARELLQRREYTQTSAAAASVGGSCGDEWRRRRLG